MASGKGGRLERESEGRATVNRWRIQLNWLSFLWGLRDGALTALRIKGQAGREGPTGHQRSYQQTGRSPDSVDALPLAAAATQPSRASPQELRRIWAHSLGHRQPSHPSSPPTPSPQGWRGRRHVALLVWNEQVWFEQQTSWMKDRVPSPGRTADTVHFAIVSIFCSPQHTW